MNVLEEYKKFVNKLDIDLDESYSIKSHDESTLFCPAGMQEFKSLFKNKVVELTLANVQRCLRLNDLDELGDSSHQLCFDMLGMFSFRKLTVK